jgi:aspartate/methionine/tyrosine aminotransferase
MIFRPTQYLEFAKSLHVSEAECNLAFSGIECPYTLEQLGIDSGVFEKSSFYPYGNALLKEAIAQRYRVLPDQILIPGGGTSLANFLVSAALLEAKDQVLLECPTYEPLEATFAFSGAQIIRFDRKFENRCNLDWQQLDDLIRPPVKLIALTRLHNPSGRNIPEEDLLRLAQKAEAIGAYVLTDEVYLDFLPPESTRIGASLHPRLITTSSLTKVYGLGDLRMGWAIGPQDLIQKCWRINNLLGAVPPAIPENIALQLYRNGGLERISSWARKRAAENFAVFERILSNYSALEWVKSDGGITVLLRLKSGQDSEAFVALLRERHKTFVMPGAYFGQSDGFRVGLGRSSEEVAAGLKRIGDAASALR